ncbi:hypothetical protein Thiowin_01459 [Thiorhodovibrio winogradskyi]|uniref:DUF4123 domain-containing protein n=1 Tax=Thiorhodovibrio winogradskyi TaxID=77007 RepID=A0ABZ0S7B7_9GAMM|nr:hypothetical protein [Thiorhodovibrio winogradskyi]
MTSLDDHVAAALGPLRVQGLIGAEARDRAAVVARLIPAAACSFFGFECRLGEAADEADFLACIAGADPNRSHWAAAGAPEGGDPVWERLAVFSRRWADPSESINTAVNNIWLEFDLDRPPATPAIPSLFLGSDALARGQAAPADHAWLIEAAEALTGSPMTPARRATLAPVLAALPEGADLFQFGMMLSRPRPILRLCLRGIPRAGLMPFLNAIDWPGDPQELARLLDRYGPLVDDIFLDLDAGSGIHAKLGLECYLDTGPEQPARLQALLQRLDEDGLVVASKRNALPAWYGITHEKWRPALWPADLARRERPSPRHSGVFLRTIHHIKLTLDPPAPMSAKAYLACRFAWVDDKALKAQLAGGSA